MRARHGTWLKPLLFATRADIERDLAQHRIAWREDASNRDAAYARNRVRHSRGAGAARRDRRSRGAGDETPAARRAGLARRAAALAAELAGAERTLARVAARALDRLLVGATRARRWR